MYSQEMYGFCGSCVKHLWLEWAGVRLTSNTVASVSHVSDACSTRLLFVMFSAFFHYFVVNDEEAKLHLPVMINVFYRKANRIYLHSSLCFFKHTH